MYNKYAGFAGTKPFLPGNPLFNMDEIFSPRRICRTAFTFAMRDKYWLHREFIAILGWEDTMRSGGRNEDDDLESLRKKVIDQGRGMVRVRRIEDRELLTAAVCPGCWNEPARRRALLRRMERLGVEPMQRDDLLEGVYHSGEAHAPECRYNPDRHWDRFARAIRDHKKR